MPKIAKTWERLLSITIDFLIYYIIFILFIKFFGKYDSQTNSEVVTGFPAFILFLIAIFLHPLSEAFSGQTIGKRLIGIKVVNEKFKHIKVSQAFIRFFLAFIDLIFLIGIIILATNNKRQRIGDLVAKTLVIDCKKE
jgi:uncharacterized RDD family membrane protein YckC